MGSRVVVIIVILMEVVDQSVPDTFLVDHIPLSLPVQPDIGVRHSE